MKQTMEQSIAGIAARSAFKQFIVASKLMMLAGQAESSGAEQAKENLYTFLSAMTDASAEQKEQAVDLVVLAMENCWTQPDNKQSINS